MFNTNLSASRMKYYKVKAQLSEQESRKVPEELQSFCLYGYKNKYYFLEEREDGWWYGGYAGCGWDFATKFPDFDWVKVPSLWHDISHWLIAKGAMHTDANDAIDKILGEDCAERSWRIMAPVRRYYMRKATNTVDQEIGEKRKIYEVV